MALFNARIPLTLRDLFWLDPFFSSNWDDFHQVHDNLRNMDEPCSTCKCSCKKNSNEENQNTEAKAVSEKSKEDSKKKEEKEDSCYSGPMLLSSRWLLPRFLDDEFALSNNLFQDKSDRKVVRFDDAKDKLTITLDAHQFKPEEIKINLKDGVLNVEAKHEEKSQDGHRFTSSHFIRRYPLPKNVKQEEVTSNLSSDGVLQITAPKHEELKDESEIKVPITVSK